MWGCRAKIEALQMHKKELHHWGKGVPQWEKKKSLVGERDSTGVGKNQFYVGVSGEEPSNADVDGSFPFWGDEEVATVGATKRPYVGGGRMATCDEDPEVWSKRSIPMSKCTSIELRMISFASARDEGRKDST